MIMSLGPVAALVALVALVAQFQDLLSMTTFTRDNAGPLIHGVTTSANVLLL